MRVLICDQESEMLERIARTFEVDIATSKATCIDLMRANPFDVLVASERLSDGSGLELLSHVATRWPETFRVLVIEPARLKLLRGKLAPFKLDATLKYPVDEDELEAVINRLYERRQAAATEEEEEPEPELPPAVEVSATQTMKALKVELPQQVTRGSSPAASGKGGGPAVVPAGSSRPAPSAVSSSPSGAPPSSSVTSRTSVSKGASTGKGAGSRGGAGSGAGAGTSAGAGAGARAAKPVGRSAQPLGTPRFEPTPVKRRLGNYTPLGSPDDSQMRIVEREFDHGAAPLASRAIRTREEAARPRTPGEKAKLLAAQLSNRLKRLLKR